MLGEKLLSWATRSSPVIRQTLRRYRTSPVREFLDAIRAGTQPALQSRADLWDAVEVEAASTLGPVAAAEVTAELRADPIVPTSSHFGVETVAESVQSTVLYALRPTRPATARYVAVFGFSSISMNNWSYPMGLSLYDPRHGRLDRLPQRLPIFPSRVKQCTVAAAEPFDQAMVRRAQHKAWQMARTGEVTRFAADAVEDLLAEIFAAPDVLALPSYRAQSPIVNARLWRRMFRDPLCGGELVQLRVEAICARLLRRDLIDPGSLIHRLFFDHTVRERLLAALDGQRACWRRAELHHRIECPSTLPIGGTIFFWGLSDTGRRIPLTLTDGRVPLLLGVEGHSRLQVEFTPDAIVAELNCGRLLPSLYTCFAMLAFARGLTCVGGYYQVEYLPVMQAGTVHALNAEHRAAADLVAQVPTRVCLAGLQGLVRELDVGGVVPAGPVELAGMGGIKKSELDAFTAMPVPNAYLVAFTELFDVLFPDANLPAGWLGGLARENSRVRPVYAPPAT